MALAQVPRLDDAPGPLPVTEAAQRFVVPPGFRIELVASEPLIREPSGVAWDERGRMFVCELHGYNLEGQYDIEELNQTGELDRVVRRVQASPQAKEKAEAETYSTIKLLVDRDSDGHVDDAIVWADHLPPCLGLCATQGGFVAACQTQILFLADRDGDDRAEVSEIWFEGFAAGPLERSINCPQWGPDNWIYFGSGSGGGTIQGLHLGDPVELPNSDFRIKPDGSAIEPVVGSTGTMGFAFTESGDRFVISTITPGIFVAPLAWRYLARNPYHSAGRLQENAASDGRVYPSSQPHPWRTHRAEDPGFSKFYTDRYGIAESAPNGYFTSACSPLIYQDTTLPGLQGQIFSCEPAQNLIHRGVVTRDGSRLTLSRAPGEQSAEFLTSTDPWFHPIVIHHAPDGSLIITDFYREIIEDYSAIPRYLQQQYGLINGHQHGRLWRLTHDTLPPDAWLGSAADMSGLAVEQLVDELASPRWWRRQTARRLLIEASATHTAAAIGELLTPTANLATVFSALQTLDGLDVVTPAHVDFALGHPDATVRRLGVQLSERWLASDASLAIRIHQLVDDPAAEVHLQTALTLGEIPSLQSAFSLSWIARLHGHEPWMVDAILSSVGEQPHALLAELLRRPQDLARADRLLEPLCLMVGHRRRAEEWSDAVQRIARVDNAQFQIDCLRGLRGSLGTTTSVSLTSEASADLKTMAAGPNEEVAAEAAELLRLSQTETAEERMARIAQAAKVLADIESVSKPSGLDPQLMETYLTALQAPRNIERGQQIFREHCGKCHQAHGTGQAVGPDLSAEFQRAEETIVRDVLAPSDVISAGYATYLVITEDGQVVTGILASESPTSVVIKQAEGVERTILRADMEQLRAIPISMMPADLYQSVSPQDLADAIAWLRNPPSTAAAEADSP